MSIFVYDKSYILDAIILFVRHIRPSPLALYVPLPSPPPSRVTYLFRVQMRVSFTCVL